MAMTTVVLYGHLRKKYGRSFEFDVSSTSEAVRALKAVLPGFYGELLKHKPGYHVFVGEQNISEKELAFPTSSTEVIRIVPVVAGAGKFNIAFFMIAAIALIASAGTLGPALAGATGTLFGSTAAAAGVAATSFIGQIGVSLALMGVASLLAPTPRKEGEEKPSYLFNGADNVVGQGVPVPVGYGRLIVGSVVLSSGVYVQQAVPVSANVPTAPITGTVIEGPDPSQSSTGMTG
ncbi:MAG: tail assembly protein [Desulfurellales bacterium]|nr:MAG: tail assembly protein [Desulfurellales bacterium]